MGKEAGLEARVYYRGILYGAVLRDIDGKLSSERSATFNSDNCRALHREKKKGIG